MKQFSIEMSSERIYDARTRDYFQEVLSSYINGNLRSSVVMLWSVAICDLVYKLQHLHNAYDDSTARAILEDIKKRQRTNPNNPEWEAELIEQVKRRTQLLDTAEYQNLVNLQRYRHLSAHPVLGAEGLLFSPNRETVRALIRNTLEGVLLKPPILTKRIVTEFVADLADKKHLLPDERSLKRYLEAKYLRNLHPAVENNLFRAVWKFVFCLINPDTDENRDINFRALKILYQRRPHEFSGYIRDHQDVFSKVSRGEPLRYLIEFLCEVPLVYNLLTDAARTLIENFVRSDINLYAVSIFLVENVEEHLRGVLEMVEQQDTIGYMNQSALTEISWERLCGLARECSCVSESVDIAIAYYARSRNFDSANVFFDRFIIPCLDSMSREQVLSLLDDIENNGQTYRRRRACEDHGKVKQRADQVLGTDFDYSGYPHFIESQAEDVAF